MELLILLVFAVMVGWAYTPWAKHDFDDVEEWR